MKTNPSSDPDRRFPNARFTVLARNCDPIKITLRNGQRLTHYSYEKTDDGYSASSTTWTHCGQCVVREWADSGRDCDGKVSREGLDKCPLANLKAGYEGNPAWVTDQPTRCRDYFAEAMNY